MNNDILEKALEMLIPLDEMNGADGMLAATYAVAPTFFTLPKGTSMMDSWKNLLLVLKKYWTKYGKDGEKTTDNGRGICPHERAS